MSHPKNIQKLINAFRKLPGIGPKMAERLAYHLLADGRETAGDMAEALTGLQTSVRLCPVCFTPSDPSDEELCDACSDPSRDKGLICIVESVGALNAVERTKKYHGLYHIVDKVISPLDGTLIDRNRITKLFERLDGVREIVIATNTDTEGEITANYIADMLRDKNVRVTRLGYGMPVGGSLEYADEITLSRSLEGRKEI
ncbi:MAG: recombination mediator RecR [Proteobacteria bacterium]|nr:recombination mediator RecR [Pseudomonadota bacterium]MBU2568205.1 recombination mediator RecR [Elusimicrobiota bacterium]